MVVGKRHINIVINLPVIIIALGIPIISPHNNKPLDGAAGVVVDILLVVEASAKEGWLSLY